MQVEAHQVVIAKPIALMLCAIMGYGNFHNILRSLGGGHIAKNTQGSFIAPRHDTLMKNCLIKFFIHESPLAIYDGE